MSGIVNCEIVFSGPKRFQLPESFQFLEGGSCARNAVRGNAAKNDDENCRPSYITSTSSLLEPGGETFYKQGKTTRYALIFHINMLSDMGQRLGNTS